MHQFLRIVLQSLIHLYNRMVLFASPATARASNVLPVPGGPTNNTPFGILAPTLVNFWGSLKSLLILELLLFLLLIQQHL